MTQPSSASSSSSSSPARQTPRLNAFLQQELQLRMRGPRAHLLLTIYLAIASALAMLIYIGAAVNNPRGQTGTGVVGTSVLILLIGLQLVLVCFITPAFAVGTISGEREQKTLDLVRTTLITPGQMVIGKLASAMGYTVLMVLATVPLYSVAFLLGGVDVAQVIIALFIILAAAFLFTSLGLFVSSRMKSNLSATILTYAIILGIVLGMPVVLLIGGSFIRALVTPTASGASTAADITPALFVAGIVAVLFISVSPITAMLVSQLAYQETSSMWSVPQPFLTGSATGGLSFPSPFVILVVSYIAVGLLLLWLTAWRLGQPDRT